jgi:hypothetical protein
MLLSTTRASLRDFVGDRTHYAGEAGILFRVPQLVLQGQSPSLAETVVDGRRR